MREGGRLKDGTGDRKLFDPFFLPRYKDCNVSGLANKRLCLRISCSPSVIIALMTKCSVTHLLTPAPTLGLMSRIGHARSLRFPSGVKMRAGFLRRASVAAVGRF